MKPSNGRGLTLMEVLIATTLAFIVVFALTQVSVLRFSTERSAMSQEALQQELLLLLNHMNRELSSANNVDPAQPLVPGASQIRLKRLCPPSSGQVTASYVDDLNNNYDTLSYRLDGLNGTVRFDLDPCPSRGGSNPPERTIAGGGSSGIVIKTFKFQDLRTSVSVSVIQLTVRVEDATEPSRFLETTTEFQLTGRLQ